MQKTTAIITAENIAVNKVSSCCHKRCFIKVVGLGVPVFSCAECLKPTTRYSEQVLTDAFKQKYNRG